jgi:hypothetical protein
VKLVNKRSADKAAHVARDRAAASAREDAKVADDDGLTETDSGENYSMAQRQATSMDKRGTYCWPACMSRSPTDP